MKYDELLRRLMQYEPHDRPIELVYLAPVSLQRELTGPFEHSFTFEEIANLELEQHPGVWRLLRSQVLSELIE